MSVGFKFVYGNNTSHSTHVFENMKTILFDYRRALKASIHLERAAVLSLRKPFFYIRLVMDMIKIKKKRKRVLHSLIPKMAFNLKLLKLETMRMIKMNGFQTSNYDRMCILLCKIAKDKTKIGFEAIVQA